MEIELRCQYGETQRIQRNMQTVGTLVETPAGPRPIEQLRVGDKVWGFDLQRHEPVVTQIQSIDQTRAKETVQVGMLRVTADHPLYANGQWKPAGKLSANDPLLARDLTQKPAGPSQTVAGEIDVYDVRVNEPKNFFAGGVLVHNGC